MRENHPKTKLSRVDVESILEAQQTKARLEKELRCVSATGLAEQYGIDRSQVYRIWSGENWPEVGE